MPKKISAYQASDGSIHEDECQAATRDVELLVQGSPLNENQPYAKKLVAWLTENSKAIRTVLETHASACPKAAEVKAMPSQAQPPFSQAQPPLSGDQPHLPNCGFHRGADCDCGAI